MNRTDAPRHSLHPLARRKERRDAGWDGNADGSRGVGRSGGRVGGCLRVGGAAARAYVTEAGEAGLLPSRRSTGDQLVCAAVTWAGVRHRRMAASRKAPRVR